MRFRHAVGMSWLFDLWNGFVNWLLSWNWGDVPGWLSIVGAILVGSIAYFRRSRIFSWFRRATNAPPSFESQPSWHEEQDIRRVVVTNYGPGDAFDVRFSVVGNLHVEGEHMLRQYNFDVIAKGESVTVYPYMHLTGNQVTWSTASLEVSWILRHDPGSEPVRDKTSWSLNVFPWANAPFPPNDPWGLNDES